MNVDKYFLRMNEAGGADGGGAPPAKEAAKNESKDTPPVKEEGDQSVDDFGYQTAPKVDGDGKKGEESGKEPDKKDPPKKEEPQKLEDLKDLGSGYGKEPVKEPEITKEEPPKEEPKTDLGYELDTKELDKPIAEKITEFAKTHKLAKEAAQALADMRKADLLAGKQAMKDLEKAQALEIASTKARWDKELRTDPTFGGDKFEHNLMRSEKVLSEFLPETKKALTERKSMLPPYVMRDLAKLGEHLYSRENLTKGEPRSAEEDKEDKIDDHLDFYT